MSVFVIVILKDVVNSLRAVLLKLHYLKRRAQEKFTGIRGIYV